MCVCLRDCCSSETQPLYMCSFSFLYFSFDMCFCVSIAVIKMFDINQDGRLQSSEYVALMKKILNGAVSDDKAADDADVEQEH